MNDRNHGPTVFDNFAMHEGALTVIPDCDNYGRAIGYVLQCCNPFRRFRIDKARDGPADKFCRFGDHTTEEPTTENDESPMWLGINLTHGGPSPT
jgi:hypothetical protein